MTAPHRTDRTHPHLMRLAYGLSWATFAYALILLLKGLPQPHPARWYSLLAAAQGPMLLCVLALRLAERNPKHRYEDRVQLARHYMAAYTIITGLEFALFVSVGMPNVHVAILFGLHVIATVLSFFGLVMLNVRTQFFQGDRLAKPNIIPFLAL